MNILFDFSPFHFKLGCSEYSRRILYSFLEKAGSRNDVRVFALYDSTRNIVYDDLTEDRLNLRFHVQFLDCQTVSLKETVADNNIDKVFFPCIQISKDLKGLAELDCGVVFVSHDIANEEQYRDRTRLYMEYMARIRGQETSKRWKRMFFAYKMTGWANRLKSWRDYIKPAIELYRANPKTRIVTVSEYSKNSLVYHYSIIPEDIKVLYSPQRCFFRQESVSDGRLRDLLESGRKYYLMVSADRIEKNPDRVFRAFRHFSASNPDALLVTVGYNGSPQFSAHIPLPFLSDGDLSEAYSNCYALLFPSFFEGFGYPPLEAMHYGKPVLASYSTSIPEILGDSAIYFCPFYESAIFDALNKLNEGNYADYAKKSVQRYEIVSRRQEKDLDALVELLLESE